MSEFFTKAIKQNRDFPEVLIQKVSDRADVNLQRYYSLLRSTKEDGIEELISAIHKSEFTTCKSGSHHNYPTGTMEHCLGVYDRMMAKSTGMNIPQKDIILVALLHDVGKGFKRGFGGFVMGHHPERSLCVVSHYLKKVSPEVLEAIRYHQHHHKDCPLQNLVCDADHDDAATCNNYIPFLRFM